MQLSSMKSGCCLLSSLMLTGSGGGSQMQNILSVRIQISPHYLPIPCFLKDHIIRLYFYKRRRLAHVITNQKISEENFHSYENNRSIAKITFSVCFALSCCRGSLHPVPQEWHIRLLPQELLHSTSEHQDNISLSSGTSLLYFYLFCASVKQGAS